MASLLSAGEDLNSTARDLWEPAAASDSYNGVSQQRILDETERKERFMVMLVTVGAILAFRNDAVGLLAGSTCLAGYRIQDFIAEKGWRKIAAWRCWTSWMDWRFWKRGDSVYQPLLSP